EPADRRGSSGASTPSLRLGPWFVGDGRWRLVDRFLSFVHGPRSFIRRLVSVLLGLRRFVRRCRGLVDRRRGFAHGRRRFARRRRGFVDGPLHRRWWLGGRWRGRIVGGG